MHADQSKSIAPTKSQLRNLLIMPHISWQSDRSYTVTVSPRILARYELLKTRPEARLKSVYFGFDSVQLANQFVSEIRIAIDNLRIEIRKARRVSTEFEVKISGIKIAQMQILERFCKTLIANIKPQPVRVIPFSKPAACLPFEGKNWWSSRERGDRTVIHSRDGSMAVCIS